MPCPLSVETQISRLTQLTCFKIDRRRDFARPEFIDWRPCSGRKSKYRRKHHSAAVETGSRHHPWKLDGVDRMACLGPLSLRSRLQEVI